MLPAIADNVAADALIITQTGTTKVKEIITSGINKSISEKDITKQLNSAIAKTVNTLKDSLLQNSVRQALITAARKWYYQLSNTYAILNRNLSNNAQLTGAAFGINLAALLQSTRGNGLDAIRPYIDFTKTAIVPVIEDYQRKLKTAMRALATEPPKVVQVKNGTAYVMPLRNYAETTVRYQSNLENVQDLKNKGVKLVWISSHPNASPRCAPYQGKLYSLDGTSGNIDGNRYTPIEPALSGPKNDGNGIISGYNCRHRMVEYVPKSQAPNEYTEAQIKREYAIDKMQRSYENNIRHAKTNAKLMDASGFADEAKAYRLKAKQLTKAYKAKSIKAGRAYYPYRYVIDASEIEYASTSQTAI